MARNVEDGDHEVSYLLKAQEDYNAFAIKMLFTEHEMGI